MKSRDQRRPHERRGLWQAIRQHKRRTALAVLGGLVSALLLHGLVYTMAGWLWLRSDNAKAKMATAGPYSALLESLALHPVPEWFKSAKFGIFLHWGLFSVPGFAPIGKYTTILQNDYDRAMVVSPYAEDYGNAMRDPSTPTAKYHQATYGAMPYSGFKEIFEAGLRDWDADVWARKFKEQGARYVVITAKYHDGFSIWPTKVANPHQPGWHTERDVLGELAAAVRRQGLKFGVYYSGGVDWTFQRTVVRTLGDYSYLYHGDDYADYVDAQVRELIDRYKPDILWNDISWPTGEQRLQALFADYYNTVPEGVVNDRWQTASAMTKFMGTWVGRGSMDAMMKLAIRNDPQFVENIKPPLVPHSDFTTPEYTQYNRTQEKKWETTRGIGHSYGYNQNETDKDYASFEDTLFPDFVDAVAKNGNLLLNAGPRGGAGFIPELQQQRLDKFGAWLRRNGEAVYDTSPWQTAQAVTDDGKPVRFTSKRGKVYAIVVGPLKADTVRIKDIQLNGSATVLGSREQVSIAVKGSDTVLKLPQAIETHSPVFEVVGP